MRKFLFIWMMICAICGSVEVAAEDRGFKAVMNGKIAVEVFFQTVETNGEWQTAGYIYYPNAKKPAPILIVENWGKEKPKDYDEDNIYDLRFEEYQPDGEITGILYLTCAEVDGDFQMMKASWKNPTNGRVMQLSKFEESRELPSWWPGAPAVFGAPRRDAWNFLYKLENEYDETGDSEWMDRISVTVEVNGQVHPMSFKAPLSGAFNSEMEETLNWVTYQDLNFDGIPDVMVYVGTSTRAQSLYKAFVWNPVTRQFYEVQAFDEIQEPDFDSQAKTITSYVRDVNYLYIETYKWKNGILKRVAVKKVKLTDD